MNGRFDNQNKLEIPTLQKNTIVLGFYIGKHNKIKKYYTKIYL